LLFALNQWFANFSLRYFCRIQNGQISLGLIAYNSCFITKDILAAEHEQKVEGFIETARLPELSCVVSEDWQP
jgi:hypothetical protein